MSEWERSVSARLESFSGLVRNVGRIRMEQNQAVFQEWRTFLERNLTPQEFEGQVLAEEARWLIDSSEKGDHPLYLAEQIFNTEGPHVRQVLYKQWQGLFLACTGCHAMVQAYCSG